MLILKMALKFKIDVIQNKTCDKTYVKTIKIQITQYFCNAITSMASAFKMLSLYMKIDDIINLQTK